MQDINPLERARRDEAAISEYRRLRDGGDRRRLIRAETGDLVLYRPEEIGFVRGGHGGTVRTRGGLLAVGIGLGLLGALALAAAVAGTIAGSGESGAFLFPALLGAAGSTWAFVLAGRERRAAALRRERGLPEPAKHPH